MPLFYDIIQETKETDIMNYSVEALHLGQLKTATMKMSIPDYSTELASRAVRTLENELERKGIELVEPAYNFLVQYDQEDRLEVIDVVVFVCVKEMGEDTEMIKFVEIEEDETIIRVTTQNFEDIHIALAEWMHDHNYVADGGLRMVIHDDLGYICDCPVKPAED